MNNRGQLGFAFLIVGLLLTITLFGLIDPLKETLDDGRAGSGLNEGLNCPGVPTFDQVDYDNDTEFERLVRRPTCFVTGISMVWFVGVFLIATSVWVVKNWRKVRT